MSFTSAAVRIMILSPVSRRRSITILVSPHFIYRAEGGPAFGESLMLTDLELASRLSFFLWSSLPDEELLTVASSNELSRPDVLRS